MLKKYIQINIQPIVVCHYFEYFPFSSYFYLLYILHTLFGKLKLVTSYELHIADDADKATFMVDGFLGSHHKVTVLQDFITTTASKCEQPV